VELLKIREHTVCRIGHVDKGSYCRSKIANGVVEPGEGPMSFALNAVGATPKPSQEGEEV
jgi:hypothetical protein